MKFTVKQRKLARTVSTSRLKKLYERSEARLELAARRGDFKGISRAMKQHQTYEYAMLYKKARRANGKSKY